MKVYFYDGQLFSAPVDKIQKSDIVFPVDAAFGYSEAKEKMKMATMTRDCNAVLTNCTFLLRSDLCWNDELGYHELYMFRNNEWKLIKDLTIRLLKKENNLERLWLAGEFR